MKTIRLVEQIMCNYCGNKWAIDWESTTNSARAIAMTDKCPVITCPSNNRVYLNGTEKLSIDGAYVIIDVPSTVKNSLYPLLFFFIYIDDDGKRWYNAITHGKKYDTGKF